MLAYDAYVYPSNFFDLRLWILALTAPAGGYSSDYKWPSSNHTFIVI
jgi:hypothetical protein